MMQMKAAESGGKMHKHYERYAGKRVVIHVHELVYTGERDSFCREGFLLDGERIWVRCSEDREGDSRGVYGEVWSVDNAKRDNGEVISRAENKIMRIGIQALFPSTDDWNTVFM